MIESSAVHATQAPYNPIIHTHIQSEASQPRTLHLQLLLVSRSLIRTIRARRTSNMAAGSAPVDAAGLAAAAVGGGGVVGYEDEHAELLAACQEELRGVRLQERRVEEELQEAMDSLLRLEGTGAEAVTVRAQDKRGCLRDLNL